MSKAPFTRSVFAKGMGLLLSLGASMPTATGSQHLTDGIRAYKAGDYAAAYKVFETNARHGDAEASYHLCSLYRTGLGVRRDEYAAFEWCQRAAKHGMLEAQYQLGIMYLDGEGVTADEDQAMIWLWTAADRGYPQATEVLEYILYNDFTIGC